MDIRKPIKIWLEEIKSFMEEVRKGWICMLVVSA